MEDITMSNPIIEAIKNRRSTRQFTDEQITEEQLDTILESAIWAPSGSNSQSWLFTAIQNKDVLMKINDFVREGLQSWTPKDDYISKMTAIRQQAQKEDYNFYYHAPTLIIASNRPNYNNAMADCALALENIFLAAESMELGSCYINQLRWLNDYEPLRDYLAELGVPREHVICSAAAVGHKARSSNAPERKPGTVKIIR